MLWNIIKGLKTIIHERKVSILYVAILNITKTYAWKPLPDTMFQESLKGYICAALHRTGPQREQTWPG